MENKCNPHIIKNNNIDNENIIIGGCENPYIIIEDNINFFKKDEYIKLESKNIKETQEKEENINKNTSSSEKKETFTDSNGRCSEENQNINIISFAFLDIQKDNNINENIEMENNLKEINNNNNKIFNVTKKKIYKTIHNYNNIPKKKGCIPKDKKNFGVEGKHNNLTFDNCIYKVLTACKHSLSKTMHLIFQNINSFSYLPKIKIKIGRSYEKYRKFCKKSQFEIYCFEKKGEYNKAAIQRAIAIDEFYGKKYKLDILFKKTTFSLIMKAFLCDEEIISVDNKFLNLIEFTTYKDWAGLNYLKIRRKEEIKEVLLNELNLRQYKFNSYK